LRLSATLAAAALAFAAAPLAAQSAGAHAHAAADPDRNASGGVQVPGWTARLDRAEAQASQVSFTRMGKGYHVTPARPASTTRRGPRRAATTR
jgi:hypothetical protein